MILPKNSMQTWRKSPCNTLRERQALRNPTFGLQGHRQFQFDPRILDAIARMPAPAPAPCCAAAAQQWQVEPSSCTTSKGRGHAYESGRSFPMARGHSRKQPAAAEGCALKDPKDFVYIASR